MTTHAKRKRLLRPAGPAGGGFTLIELLVVIAILGMLLGIMIPTLNKVRIGAKVQKTQKIINQLSVACDMYQDDHKIYPVSGPSGGAGYTGSQRITQALTGYFDHHTGARNWGNRQKGDDGEDGYGFTLFTRGRKYGPYNGTHELKVHVAREENLGEWKIRYCEFLDGFDRPILYYRFEESGYDAGHNTDGPSNLVGEYLRGPGGDIFRKDFVLLSRGPNGKWNVPYKNNQWQTDCDDPNNFQEQ